MSIGTVFGAPLNAYQKAQGLGTGLNDMPASPVKAGGNFADVLASYTQDAVQVLKQGEQATLLAAQGKADITEVVTAVSNAELTLQTIVSVRDRVINAYQDILRMPI